MPNGFCARLSAALLVAASLAVPTQLMAQIYRCETASGVTYSDMPCGAGAEEIVVAGEVLDSRGLGHSESAEAGLAAQAEEQGIADGAPPAVAVDAGQGLDNFLSMLRSQQQAEVGQIDAELARLREEAANADFLGLDVSQRDQLNEEIAQLESDRAAVVSEYDALISEAETRLE